MKKPVFLHLRKTTNLGDLSCCPADGFPVFDHCERLHVTEWESVESGVPLIFGGGGLFMPGTSGIFRAAAQRHPVAVWGAGLNFQREQFSPEVEDALVYGLKQCALVGVRNFSFAHKHGFVHVPCPSATSTAFNYLNYEGPIHLCRAYEHYDRRFAGARIPSLTNTSPSFYEAIRWIAGSRFLVTNSYHGAYWASLLGRQVILWNPQHFGNRFVDLTAPTVRNFEELFTTIGALSGFRSAPCLDAARQENRDFCKRILAWLEAL